MAEAEGSKVLAETSQKDLLRYEQVKLLYEAMPVSIVATFISSVVLVLVEWKVIDHSLLVAWLVGLLLITAGRTLITVAYRQAQPKPAQTSLWEKYFLVGTIASGLFWGAATLIVFPENSMPHQLFLVFIVGGMCAGAVTSLSPIRSMALSFLVLALTPLIVHLFLVGSDIYIAMGLMVLVFLILISFNAIAGYRSTEQNIVLRLESAEREAVIRRAEEALKQEAAFRESIIDRAGEGLCVCHRLTYFPFVVFTVWNRRMHQITGYSMEEINRKGWFQTLYRDPEDEHRAKERMNSVRFGSNQFSEESEITCADGEKRSVLISTTMITSESEEPQVLMIISG
jgi:PAS domain S-box-containing protein